MEFAIKFRGISAEDCSQIRTIVEEAEIVIGVRLSPKKADQIECMLIKGTYDIREIMAASRSDRRRVIAIRCISDEQSEVLHQIACEQSWAAAASL